MKCTKIFILRKTHFYVQVTMYARNMFSRATEICFFTCLTLLMMFKSSDYKGSSFRVISGNYTGKMCPFLIFLEIYFGIWSPFVSYNTYKCAYMYYKRQNISPSEGRVSLGATQLFVARLQAYGGLAIKKHLADNLQTAGLYLFFSFQLAVLKKVLIYPFLALLLPVLLMGNATCTSGRCCHMDCAFFLFPILFHCTSKGLSFDH